MLAPSKNELRTRTAEAENVQNKKNQHLQIVNFANDDNAMIGKLMNCKN